MIAVSAGYAALRSLRLDELATAMGVGAGLDEGDVRPIGRITAVSQSLASIAPGVRTFGTLIPPQERDASIIGH